MIKKTIKVILDGASDSRFNELGGGMPLSKGEIVNFKENAKITEYLVLDKKTEIEFVGQDLIVTTTYTLKKK